MQADSRQTTFGDAHASNRVGQRSRPRIRPNTPGTDSRARYVAMIEDGQEAFKDDAGFHPWVDRTLFESLAYHMTIMSVTLRHEILGNV